MTGNTVIDALLWVIDRIQVNPPAQVAQLQEWVSRQIGKGPLVLITGHRRESFGEGFENICQAIAQLAEQFRDVHWVYPAHLNPHVQRPVRRILAGKSNVHLLDPLPYAAFAWLMDRSTLILTDSGGIQEEAPSLHKFVLVMRNKTERPEGIEAGCAKLVGNRAAGIVEGVTASLDEALGGRRPDVANPYGDGHSAERIVDAIAAYAQDDTGREVHG